MAREKRTYSNALALTNGNNNTKENAAKSTILNCRKKMKHMLDGELQEKLAGLDTEYQALREKLDNAIAGFESTVKGLQDDHVKAKQKSKKEADKLIQIAASLTTKSQAAAEDAEKAVLTSCDKQQKNILRSFQSDVQKLKTK